MHALTALGCLAWDHLLETRLDQWVSSWSLMSLVNMVYGFGVVLWYRSASSNPSWALPLPWIHLLLNLAAILLARSLGVLDTKVGAMVFLTFMLLDLAFVNRALVSILRPH